MRCCTYLFFFVCLHGGHIYAGPAEELRDAENSYLYGDYDRVVRKIIPVIEPDLLLSDENKIARAYELLVWRYLEDKEMLDDNSKSSFVYGQTFGSIPSKFLHQQFPFSTNSAMNSKTISLESEQRCRNTPKKRSARSV